MFDAPAHELMLRSAILLIPVVVLILLFTLLYYRRLAELRNQPHDEVNPGAADTFLRGTAPGSMPAKPAGAGTRAPDLVSPEFVGAGPSKIPVNAESIFSLEQKFADAKAKGAPLAVHYLALGRAKMAAGEETAALNALRSAAGEAARHGPARVHAEARIELAEAAVRAGDPTSACEHWQMARMAFLEAGAKADGEKVDLRMRANGCPTDWVLTDF